MSPFLSHKYLVLAAVMVAVLFLLAVGSLAQTPAAAANTAAPAAPATAKEKAAAAKAAKAAAKPASNAIRVPPRGNVPANAAATPAAANARPAIPARNVGSGVPAKNSTAAAPTATAAQPGATTPASAASPASSATRAPVSEPGVYVFKAGDYAATAYGCSRSGARVLCDFDMTKTRAAQTGLNLFGSMKLVSEGGKISNRSDAFFVFEDGSQDKVAYLSATPVRMIMVFDNVSASATTVSLSNGRERVESIPLAAEQAQGSAQGQQPAASAPATPAASGAKTTPRNGRAPQAAATPHP